MRRTALRGHALRSEGKPFIRAEYEEGWRRAGWGIGYAVCECGKASPHQLDTDAARKRWHAQHKDEVRQGKDSTDG